MGGKGKKRKANQDGEDAIIGDPDPQVLAEWKQKILKFGSDRLTKFISELAREGNVSISEIKKAKKALPSFSNTRWNDIAPYFGLSLDLWPAELGYFRIDALLLPMSFHQAATEAAWQILDVYREPLYHEREEEPDRVFNSYLIRIVGLFHGRVVDMPERPMMSTTFSSGGRAEHEIFMIGGILFYIIETKLRFEGKDDVAQLFAELISAAEMNKTAKFGRLRIHGIVTDLRSFRFYSYDPIQEKLYQDETLSVSDPRDTFMRDMICVTNKIFSVILHGYIEGLAAKVEASRERSPASPQAVSKLFSKFGSDQEFFGLIVTIRYHPAHRLVQV